MDKEHRGGVETVSYVFQFITDSTFMNMFSPGFCNRGVHLECTEYLRHNLMRFVIQVIILVALVVYDL